MVVEPFETWTSSIKKVEEPKADVPKATIDRWTAAYADADAGSLGLPTRKTEEQIVQENAPVLVLPEGQYNLPADPQDFIDNARLVEERSATGELSWTNNPFVNPGGYLASLRDRVIGDNTNGSTDDDFTAARVAQSGHPVYLDLEDGKRGELGDPNAPFFYQTEKNEDGETTRVTYWSFYAYNEGPGVQPSQDFRGLEVADDSGGFQIRQNHEGDFERITVEIDPETQEATHIVFSAHEAPHDRVEIGDVDTIDGRPVVYVADGSHGSYAEPGDDHHTSDPTGILKDRTALDTNGDGVVDGRDEGVVIIDTSSNLHDVTDQTWYPEQGEGVRWGEIGEFDFTSGPEGPSERKAHVSEDGNG